MAKRFIPCVSCGKQFAQVDGEVACPRCEPTAKPFTLALTAEELRRLESLAVIRGTTPESALRQLLESSTASPSVRWEKRKRRK
jgi:hypothetical protein